MSFAAFYQQEAERCDHLAAAATNPSERARYRAEGVLRRAIAKDIARQDRDEAGPP